MFCLALVLLLGGASFIGGLVLKYHRIVGARPGALRTEAQPGELGQWVNPFVGTGGVPWVCGNNFPGAMTPFGMVRLGPETASMLIRKRALNTSGYYYGDDRVLGFSHTRLNGTGATDGGHFLVLPARATADPQSLREGETAHFRHSHERAFPGCTRSSFPAGTRSWNSRRRRAWGCIATRLAGGSPRTW